MIQKLNHGPQFAFRSSSFTTGDPVLSAQLDRIASWHLLTCESSLVFIEGEVGSGRRAFAHEVCRRRHANARPRRSPSPRGDAGSAGILRLRPWRGERVVGKIVREYAGHSLVVEGMDALTPWQRAIVAQLVKAFRVHALAIADIGDDARRSDGGPAKAESTAGLVQGHVYISRLRERTDDVPHLIRHFVGDEQRVFSSEALCFLKSYVWPGNVQQLKSLCTLATARRQCSAAPLTAADVESCLDLCDYEAAILSMMQCIRGLRASRSPTVDSYGVASHFWQVALIRDALESAGQNCAAAAAFLDLPATTLNSKMGALRRSLGVDLTRR